MADAQGHEARDRRPCHARHSESKIRVTSVGFVREPNIVLPKQRKIIFVHGCFWHLHACRYGTVFRSTTVTALKRQPDGSWKVGRVLGVLDSPLPGAK